MCDPCCKPMMCCEISCEPSCCEMPSCCPAPPSPCPSSCCPSPCPSMCCPSPSPCPPACPPKRCKSRELRGGNLITICECVKRNGLQLDCPRSECRGRPRCVKKPVPDCCPSKYMWRYANVTMGKAAFAVPKKPCCPAPGDCNPCAFPTCCE